MRLFSQCQLILYCQKNVREKIIYFLVIDVISQLSCLVVLYNGQDLAARPQIFIFDCHFALFTFCLKIFHLCLPTNSDSCSGDNDDSESVVAVGFINHSRKSGTFALPLIKTPQGDACLGEGQKVGEGMEGTTGLSPHARVKYLLGH